jgi:hypothetical protein
MRNGRLVLAIVIKEECALRCTHTLTHTHTDTAEINPSHLSQITIIQENMNSFQQANQEPSGVSSLPLKQVTLYKNELVYLERRGKVSAAQLEIAATVKKLVLSTLSVKSQVPFTVLNKKSDEVEDSVPQQHQFTFHTAKNIGGFLSSLIGAHVALEISEGGIKEGYVMLVEKKEELVEGTAIIPVVKEKCTAVHLITVDITALHLSSRSNRSNHSRNCPKCALARSTFARTTR